MKLQVERIFGHSQRDALQLHLDSIATRKAYVRYHYAEALDRINKILSVGDDEINLVKRMLGNDDDGKKYRKDEFEAGAHIVACLQSMHSTWDIFASAIYLAVGMNLSERTKIHPTRIGLEQVVKKLSIMAGMSELCEFFYEMTNDPDYVYINAVVNQSKHRNVIAPFLRADMTGARKHEFMFSSFVRDGQTFHGRAVKELLEKEHARQIKVILVIGRELNRWAVSHP